MLPRSALKVEYIKIPECLFAEYSMSLGRQFNLFRGLGASMKSDKLPNLIDSMSFVCAVKVPAVHTRKICESAVRTRLNS
jgi:hypothetical protein